MLYFYLCSYLFFDFSFANRDARGNAFKEAHAFIGYQKDTPAAVVFQATNQLKKLLSDCSMAAFYWEKLQKVGIVGNIPAEELRDVGEKSDVWKETVS